MKRPSPRLLVIPVAFLAPLALSHVNIVIEGIHLKGAAVDFGVPPRQYGYAYSDGMSEYGGWRPGTSYASDFYAYDGGEKARWYEKVSREAFQKARKLEAAGDTEAALRIYRDMVHRGLMGYGENRERIEILTQVKSDTPGLRPLLESIGSKATQPLPKLDDVAPVLKPFVAYHAADNLGLSVLGAKGAAYLRVAQTYPHSTRAEPSLIMAARVILTDRGPKPSLPEMQIAHSALQKLLADYPDSRFRANALGWLGRIDRHQGRLLEAEAKYERQFSASRLQRDRMSALDSLAEVAKLRKRRDLAALAYLRKFGIATGNPYEQVQHLQGRIDSFNGTDARLFSGALHKDPQLLLAYLNYRIQFTELSDDVLRFGRDLPRFPKAERLKVGVKLAEASMRLGRSVDAKRYVSMTRGHGIEGDDAALAEFLHGTLEMRAGRYNSALTSFRTIRSRYGKSYLVPGAMENLTILSERTGRLGDALHLYHEMGYRHDFAYMVDARMSPAQLETYLRRPDAAQRSVVTYTLGMRYLRQSRWNDAERTFAKLTTKQRRDLTIAPEWMFDAPDSLQDPMATLKALRALDTEAKRARGPEAKASAMYKMASYYYTHRPLLFYSPQLWQGNRAISFSYSWNPEIATAADRRALSRHHYEHESLVHALEICQEIVRKYPKTSIAGHAAYRGSCAAERLAVMAPYWRWVDYQKDLLGESVRLMKVAVRDPGLGKAARKYKGVFAEYRQEARASVEWNKSLPKRTWDPRGE